ETTSVSWLTGAPSTACAAPVSGADPNINAKMIRSDVRITPSLARTAWMGHSPSQGWPNLLGIFPERTRHMVCLARRPFGSTFRQFGVGQFYVKGSGDGIDLDDVPVLQQPDRAPNGGFGADMANAEAAGGAREPAIGDQGDFAAHALPG